MIRNDINKFKRNISSDKNDNITQFEKRNNNIVNLNDRLWIKQRDPNPNKKTP